MMMGIQQKGYKKIKKRRRNTKKWFIRKTFGYKAIIVQFQTKCDYICSNKIQDIFVFNLFRGEKGQVRGVKNNNFFSVKIIHLYCSVNFMQKNLFAVKKTGLELFVDTLNTSVLLNYPQNVLFDSIISFCNDFSRGNTKNNFRLFVMFFSFKLSLLLFRKNAPLFAFI